VVDAARGRAGFLLTGGMAEICEDYRLWDPLREQDWESLGIVAQDSLDPERRLGWDCVSMSGDSEMTSAPTSNSIDFDPHNFDTDNHRPLKVAITSPPRAREATSRWREAMTPLSSEQVCLQFTSPVCSEGCTLEEEASWAFESSHPGFRQSQAHCSSSTRRRHAASVSQATGAQFGAARDGTALDQGSDADSFNSRFGLSLVPGRAESKGWVKNQGPPGGRPVHGPGLPRTLRLSDSTLRPSISGSKVGEELRGKSEDCRSWRRHDESRLDELGAARKAGAQEESGLFAVHLFVTAIAEGKVLGTANPKVRAAKC
jgi:hypothetical protein